jgi:hypothetical protein
MIVFALVAVPSALSGGRTTPEAKRCISAWNTSASFAQRNALMRRNATSATVIVIPALTRSCLVVFATATGTFFSTMKPLASANAVWSPFKPFVMGAAFNGWDHRIDQRGNLSP